ncbi:MAG TPA: hypothetical protein VHD87_14805 [Acidimicrobiales bacterium]|nr:hypothetical protein [Acidimicrobiales bacterium]
MSATEVCACGGTGVLERRVVDGVDGLVACAWCDVDPEPELRRRGFEPVRAEDGDVRWRRP